ncbi:MAG: hypothetical protein GYB65_13685 [Chloroflexi bacterium]|nr:hypothetical protein [Chloroflexota bacterium]
MIRILVRLILVGVTFQVAAWRADFVTAQDGSGAVCVTVFADENSDGLHGLNESTLPGASLNLLLGDTIIATHVMQSTDGEAYCFEDLPPGTYTVTLLNSDIYRITTLPPQPSVEVIDGASPPLTFGAKPVSQETLRAELEALAPASPAQPGSICVSTFADIDGDGNNEADTGIPEQPLAGVNVNLITDDIIVANHITSEGETEYCFEGLVPGVYTVSFAESPLYRFTTGQTATRPLEAGQILKVDAVGAAPVAIDNLRAYYAARNADTSDGDEPLEMSSRLLLAMVGSMVVMVFMIGLGAVLLGTANSGRRRYS